MAFQKVLCSQIEEMKKLLLLMVSVFGVGTLSAQLSVQTINTPYLIDFDNTVAGVNSGQWNGGLYNLNIGSFLNSNAWAFTGFSEGNAAFGDINISAGDYYNSPTTNLPLVGGLWPFGIGGVWANRVLGIRPSSADFTLGTITLRSLNATGDTIDQVRVEYDIFSRNDKNISNSLNASFSQDNSSYQALSTLDFATPEASGSTAWDSVHRDTTVNVTWLVNTYFYVRWSSDSLSGSGTGINLGDILGIDNVRITALSGPPLVVTALSDTVVCLDSLAGDSLYVNYDAEVAYPLGNVFSVELSDSVGGFGSPQVIGSINDTVAQGSIGCVLPAGTSIGNGYAIRVVASLPLGYSVVYPVSLTVSELPSVNYTSQAVTCNGDQNGSIALTPDLGFAPYQYTWTGGASPQNLTALNGGYYTVEVEDAYGCNTQVDSIEVEEPDAVQIGVTTTESLCFGDNLASISVSTSGGMPSASGYAYNWDNGENSPLIDSLSVGSYALTVTDSLGCNATTTIVVTEPEELAFGHVTTDPLCYGQPNGSILLFPTGGTGTLSYAWSSGASSPNLTNVAAGTYSITITDANGCEASENAITLTEPDSLQLAMISADASCQTCADGAIQVIVSGATPPYDYSWSNGSNTKDISGLEAGNYTLTVTDDNGCEHVIEQGVDWFVGISNLSASDGWVVFPNPVVSSVFTLQSEGGSQAESLLLVNAIGQTMPITFTSSSNQVHIEAKALPAGVYRLLIRSQDGSEHAVNLLVNH